MSVKLNWYHTIIHSHAAFYTESILAQQLSLSFEVAAGHDSDDATCRS